MEIEKAVEILKRHNEWRRYDGEIENSPKMQDPKEIGEAIDEVLEFIKTGR